MNPGTAEASGRDVRLDFVRGLALLIIFVNHVPENEGLWFTPSRYGFSDAAEIFVFCSGCVSALVFGQCLERSGLALGTLRILQRCTQIYAAHLGLFTALALLCLAGNALFPPFDYVGQLNLHYFFDQTREALPALATLSYVPNLIDILPMYLVLLAWTPVFWALARLNRPLAWGASLALYLATYHFDLDLTAEPNSDRPWFFNPFAWQLLFFGGFSLGAGWIKVPLGNPHWMRLAALMLLLAVPLAHEPALRPTDGLRALRFWLEPGLEKTRLGPFRILHFTALAYLTASLLQRHRALLERSWAVWVRTCGEHSLAIFSIGLLLAWSAGMAFRQLGHGLPVILTINLGGIALLLATAQLLSWLAGKPWKRPPRRLAEGWLAVRSSRFAWSEVATATLRSLAWTVLLLPLAVTPFLLPRKQALTLASVEPLAVPEALEAEGRDDGGANSNPDPGDGANTDFEWPTSTVPIIDDNNVGPYPL